MPFAKKDMPLATETIKISKPIRKWLDSMKLYARESYNDVLVRIKEVYSKKAG